MSLTYSHQLTTTFSAYHNLSSFYHHIRRINHSSVSLISNRISAVFHFPSSHSCLLPPSSRAPLRLPMSLKCQNVGGARGRGGVRGDGLMGLPSPHSHRTHHFSESLHHHHPHIHIPSPYPRPFPVISYVWDGKYVAFSVDSRVRLIYFLLQAI